MPNVSEGFFAYIMIFALLIMAGMGFPIPEELPVIASGGLCAHVASKNPDPPEDWTMTFAGLPYPELAAIEGAVAAIDIQRKEARKPKLRHPVWWIMLPVCIIGVVISDGVLYSIGRFGGTRLLEIGWVKRRLLPAEKRAKIEDNFHKYGVKILLGARLLPGIRAPIFVMAGVMRLPLPRFLFADGVYAVPGVTLLFTLAYWFTHQVTEAVEKYVHNVSTAGPYIIIGVIAIVGCFMLYEFWKRRNMKGDPKEVPIIGEKVIKPTETDAFPDTAIVESPPREERPAEGTAPGIIQKTSRGIGPFFIMGVVSATGLFKLYDMWKSRSVKVDPGETPIAGENAITPAIDAAFPDPVVVESQGRDGQPSAQKATETPGQDPGERRGVSPT